MYKRQFWHAGQDMNSNSFAPSLIIAEDIISFHAKFKLDIARSFGIMSDEEAVNFQKQRRMLNENNWYYWRNGS